MAFCAGAGPLLKMAIPTYARLTPDLRPTYAPLTPERQLPARIVRGPLKAILVQLGRVWAFKLVVVLMAYATTYAQLTPAYASLRQHVSNRAFPELFQ